MTQINVQPTADICCIVFLVSGFMYTIVCDTTHILNIHTKMKKITTNIAVLIVDMMSTIVIYGKQTKHTYLH